MRKSVIAAATLVLGTFGLAACGETAEQSAAEAPEGIAGMAVTNARLVLPAQGRDGFDYVLIGRREVTATRDFAEMRADLERALKTAHP